MSSQKHLSKFALLAAFALAGLSPASAHLTYGGRTFQNLLGNGSDTQQSIAIGNLAGVYGWADGTDADFGDSHRTRAFRFTLDNPMLVTISVQGIVVGASPALQFPAFSLYSGLAQVSLDAAGHDGSNKSFEYLNTFGPTPIKEGVFQALTSWSIGNDPTYNTPGDSSSGIAIPAILKTLTYIGHAADGTIANYGNAPGINGDGLADGFVTGSFSLAAGDYTLIVGGADYNNQADAANRGVIVTVPEPSTAALLGLAAPGLLTRRRRS